MPYRTNTQNTVRNITARNVAAQAKAMARSAFESLQTTVSFLRAYFTTRLTPILGEERGEIASWVVVTALVVAASIVIVAVITTKLTNTANNIQTP
jgi:hypothetical protein